MLLVYLILMLSSFYLLAKVCEGYFVESLDAISRRFKLSSEMAGATLMAMGSSAPELFVSLIAVFRGAGESSNLGAGTIVGSALFNILVIIGASALVRKAILTWQPVVRDTLFYSFSIIMLLLSFADGRITLTEGLFFLFLYAVYVFAVVNWKKWFGYEEHDPIPDVSKAIEEEEKTFHWWEYITLPFDATLRFVMKQAGKNHWAIFGISVAAIAAFSWLLVESAVGAAHILGIPETIIALTILAAGTSIPDLLASLIVARTGRGGMAISNAVGSNIFDILFGLGFPWVLLFLIYPNRTINVDTGNLISSVILLFATVVATLFIYIASKWKVGRKGGALLVIAYIGYLVFIISKTLQNGI